MINFSDGPSPGHDTADFDVTNCFLKFYTFITRDELPTALNICGNNIFLNFTNINLKISDK